MARRRGFFAELQHQAAVAERDRQRAQAAQVREQVRQQKEWERALAASHRAREQAAKADERALVAAERESKRLYGEARQAEADALTAASQVHLQEIDDILQATLSVDDYVDLEALRRSADHPPFTSPHSVPTPPPVPPDPGPQPWYAGPEMPAKRLRPGQRHERVTAGESAWVAELDAWWLRRVAAERSHAANLVDHERREVERRRRLERDRAAYEQDCRLRESETADSNRQLDRLIVGFDRSEPTAVEEYFGIVLGNSAYPDGLQPDYQFTVDVAAKELTIEVLIVGPDAMPTDKGHKYVKARDEMAAVPLTQKESRDRYAAMLHNIAMRTLHELWEADRAHKLGTISMTVGVTHVDPATGHDAVTPLLAAAVDRDQFESLNLAQVDAAASLVHLGAVVSKQPWALAAINTSAGVRTR